MKYSKDEKSEIIKKICDNVVTNEKSFNEAISESSINRMSFYRWIADDEELAKCYNYAREVRSDVLFEEIIKISDTIEIGEEITEKSTGIERKLGDMTNHRRLRIDARKWVVSKMNPKKYGDKMTLDGNLTVNPFLNLMQSATSSDNE
jgi:hypothetical protein